ncbi:HAD family hydrolase [Luteolibacter sp. LG18]|uniref:HAD family hydrolase n=1 Tax=Luteolibacter sp. LG18 TaxID=2819286 RepID=UPI002B2BB5E6|nr:hypothetical protein llg_14760 [Luteolibacter sp. LG18]
MPFPTDTTRPRGIALFDLDGTLLPWDCQVLFCHRVLRRAPWRRFYLLVFLPFTPFAKWLGAETMKRIFLCYLWRMESSELVSHARAFARELRFYPEVLAELERHRAKGDLLVLTSASPEFYVTEIGRRLGFDLTLGTPVEIPDRLPFFPDLKNHKGMAKVDRLRELMPDRFKDGHLRNSHGYTDSTADLPLLAICKTATLINPSEHLTAIGRKRGWNVTRPTRPWKSKWDRLRRLAALVAGIGRNPGGLES